jgi:hypothetical protein
MRNARRWRRIVAMMLAEETQSKGRVVNHSDNPAGDNQLATTPPESSTSEPETVEQPSLLYRAVYGIGYCLSFGIMFPTLFVVRVIPLDNAFGDGLCDGTVAAKDTSAAAHAGMRKAAESVAHKASDVYAGVSRKVQERVEAVQDALAERRHRRQIASQPVSP